MWWVVSEKYLTWQPALFKNICSWCESCWGSRALGLFIPMDMATLALIRCSGNVLASLSLCSRFCWTYWCHAINTPFCFWPQVEGGHGARRMSAFLLTKEGLKWVWRVHLHLGLLGDHRSSEYHVLFFQDLENDNSDVQKSTELKSQSAAAWHV